MLASGRGGGGEGRGGEAAAMGNKMCVSRGRAVAERLTRPQRLLRQPSDVDYKKLRKLILAQKLAPCFDAVDDPQLAAGDLEECPICFLYYPSLNRSRCCAKGICTECFLQMKPSHASQPAQCPFCKNSCYAVQYHGARTEEEKSLEQAEEQKVIEAKIRMQSESPIGEILVPANQSQTLLELLHPFPDVEGPSSEEGEGEIVQLQISSQQETIDGDGSSYPNMCPTRHEEVDVDLEEIMVMEAIWLSLQDSRSERSESSEMSSRSHRESHAGTRFPSRDQGESCSTTALTEDVSSAIARLADADILQQKVLELNWGTSPTDQRNSYENFVLESNSMQPEGGCSSGSGLNIA